MLSAVGGALSLYLGTSLIAVFELLELVIRLFIVILILYLIQPK